jgi:hypothetical protein
MRPVKNTPVIGKVGAEISGAFTGYPIVAIDGSRSSSIPPLNVME